MGSFTVHRFKIERSAMHANQTFFKGKYPEALPQCILTLYGDTEA